MEITYNLQEEDYVTFNLNHIENSPSQKRILMLARYLVPFISGLAIFYIGTSIFNQPEIYWFIVALSFMVGWWIYYPKTHEKSIRKQTMRLLNEGDNTSLFGEKKMIIEEDAIQIIDKDSSAAIYAKENIKNIKEYDKQLVIYLSAVQGIIIPKRNMDTATQERLVEALKHFKSPEIK